MIRTPAEIFNNKVSLIYEYNKKSPLFVRKANQELEANNAEKAVEILTAGIKIYPNYAAAYIILFKAYTAIGNISEAAKVLKTGCDLIRSPRSYEYYTLEINNPQQRSLFQHGTIRSFNEDEIEKTEQPDLFGEIKSEIINEPAPEKIQNDYDKPYPQIEDRLDEIAKGLSTVKLNEVVPASEPDYNLNNVFADNNIIISETLAKIYAAQGELKEAIQVYKKLIKKHPHKEDYYNEKINELRSQLE